MKKVFRIILTTILLLSILCSTVCISGYAASAVLIFNSSVQVNKNISVTLKLTADEGMYATQAYISFDSSKLKFNSGDSAAMEGKRVKIVGTPGGSKSQSYTLSFTAIATGETRITAQDIIYVGSEEKSLPNASDKLTIKSNTPVSSTPTVSKNANLSSLRVKNHELSPAFSPSITSYTVTARYPMEQITIFASAEHAEATFVGAGTYDLQVGENERIVTVTAEDGKTKKSYFITIKRLTEQDTVEYDAQNAILNPLAVHINDIPHHIASDLTGVTPPAGFTATTIDHKGATASVFVNADKSYTLYWLTDDETKQGDFYTYDSITNTFTPLPYIIVNGNIYILADLPQTYAVPAGYSIVSLPLGNTSTTAFVANDPRLTDFYMIYLHYNGATQFYRFDKAETTLQRAPYFELGEYQPVAETTPLEDLLAQFNALSQTEKILLYALGGALVLILILLISIIVIINRKSKKRATEQDNDIAPFIDLQDSATFPAEGFDEDDQPQDEDADEESQEEQASDDSTHW